MGERYGVYFLHFCFSLSSATFVDLLLLVDACDHFDVPACSFSCWSFSECNATVSGYVQFFFKKKMFGGRYVVIRGPPKDIYIVLVLKFFSTYY